MHIISNVGKRGALCKCTQCGNEYRVKCRFSAKKSSIGHLCNSCKDLMKNLQLTKDYLQKVLIYKEDTGILRHRLTSSSGKSNEVIGTMHSSGYLECSLGDKPYLVHRLIWTYMTDEIPEQVDHIDHDRTNNRWKNLRKATNTENSMNASIGTNNTSGILGVAMHKPTGKYRAYINSNRKQIHLGLFDTLVEAEEARKLANIKYKYHANHGK